MSASNLTRKRVVIVDDSRTMQVVLEQLLTTKLNYEVVGIADDGAAAIAMVRRLHPDLVTIDLALPYIDGREILTEFKSFENMRKVVISGSARDSLTMKAGLEKLGADGCISKHDMARDPDAFCRALAAIMRTPKKLVPEPVPVRAVSRPPVFSYPVPPDEKDRLVALATLGLANDDPDHQLDLLTEHMVKTTSFPACVMTFIDQHTQWTKSACGMPRGAKPRAQAICNHTICGDEPFIVSDTSTDNRFNKFDDVVSGPMIGAYVGYPVVSSSGVHLGAICLLDTVPHRVAVKELSNLRSIARIAAGLIERAVPRIRAAA